MFHGNDHEPKNISRTRGARSCGGGPADRRQIGADSVFDNTRIALVLDHFAPNKDIKAAEQCRQTRAFAGKYDIKNFFDVGRMGIEHALLPE